MFEYAKVMWENLGPIGIGSILGFVLYNLLLIFAVYKLEKQVKILMREKMERDAVWGKFISFPNKTEQDKELAEIFQKRLDAIRNGIVGESAQVVSEISEEKQQ